MMKTFSKLVLALGLTAFLAGPVLAQQGGGPRGGGFGGGNIPMLLSNASVQHELKLDAGQIEKAKELAEKSREKSTAFRESAKGLSGEERFSKMRELNHEINTEALKTAKDFLKEDQVKRLHEIRLQTMGAAAFEDAHVVKHLKMTDDQKSVIETIVRESNTEMRSIFQSSQGDREGAMAKVNELRKETLAKVHGKLTAEQKADYEKMLGSHFDIKYEAPPGR